MKNIYLSILMFVPFVLSAQYGDKEIYGYARAGIDVNMKNTTYNTILKGVATDNPLSVSLKLGGGITTEAGVGFMIIRRFFLEPNLAYTFLSEKIKVSEEATNYISNYQFNKFIISMNGVYVLDVDASFNLVFFGGASLLIPQNLIVNTSNGYETVYYKSSAGINAGFGANYEYDEFVFEFGLKYKTDFYKTAMFQDLPPDFHEINAHLMDFKTVGINLLFTVKYLF